MGISFEIWYTAALLLIMNMLLIIEVLEIEVVIFSTLLLLIAGKVITLKEAFVGFPNEGMLTISLMYRVFERKKLLGILSQKDCFAIACEDNSMPSFLQALVLGSILQMNQVFWIGP